MLKTVARQVMGKRVKKIRRLAIAIPRGRKKLLLGLSDGASVIVGVAAAWGLVYRGSYLQELAWFIPMVTVLAVATFSFLGLYRSITRFVGRRVGFRLLQAVAIVAAAIIAMAAVTPIGTTLDAAVLGAVFAAFALLLVGGSRFFARAFLLRPGPGCERVLIYGAGAAGVGLEATLASQGALSAVAFVDDDPRVQGTFVNGLPVLGPLEVPGVIAREDITRVFLALPSASRPRRKEILRFLEPHAVRVQTVPDIADLVAGRARVDDIRDVSVHDILGREPVQADDALLSTCVTDKTIMVTGAGGSIGSELCRQLLVHQPRRLLLFELSELALYNVERQLRQVAASGLRTELIPLLGNVQDPKRVAAVLSSFKVDTVYHAAAYKHVPIVERNISEGIRNNAMGTHVVAEAARQHGVGVFVLVSTDKAVAPTSMLGASKRLAELVLQGMQPLVSRTRFCIVRFGNVLESSGSVVPLFREQIRSGGPVTVTHPDVTRYFMTIPEAAQLVIQAGAMSRGGDVFVLEMGKPVKIADLAARLIRLMGLTVKDKRHPAGDIGVEFTGLRPGEKLHEELLLGTSVEGTDHPKIMRATEKCFTWEQVRFVLDSLDEALERSDLIQVASLLSRVVDGYDPKGLRDHVMDAATAEPAKRAAGASITFLPGKLAAESSLSPASGDSPA